MKQVYPTKQLIRIILVSTFLSFAISSIKAQNVVVSDDDGYTADNSAMLDVKSTTKGLLIPRVTSAQRVAISSPATGLLVFDSTEKAFYYYDGTLWVNLSKGQVWSVNNNYVYLTDINDKVGIGTSTPNSKLEVKADASFGAGDTLFVVKDSGGNPVFAVFPDGAKVYVDDNAKGSVGGFAVSGRSPAKGEGDNYLYVTPDSTRIYINEPDTKGSVGGFAVSGRSPGKGPLNDYFLVNSDSTRVYMNDTLNAKGSVGGFAVSGRSPAKSGNIKFMDMTPKIYLIGQEAGKGISTGSFNSFMSYQAGKFF